MGLPPNPVRSYGHLQFQKKNWAQKGEIIGPRSPAGEEQDTGSRSRPTPKSSAEGSGCEEATLPGSCASGAYDYTLLKTPNFSH